MVTKNLSMLLLLFIIHIGTVATANAQKTAKLTINTVPDDAKIYIMNIKPKYKNAMRLETNKDYKIKVVKNGYHTHNQTIKLLRNKTLLVDLKSKQRVYHKDEVTIKKNKQGVDVYYHKNSKKPIVKAVYEKKHENREKWVRFIKDGLSYNYAKIYNSSNQLTYVIEVRDGKFIGKQTLYYPSGAIKKIYFVNENLKVHGKYKEFYESGYLKSITYYNNGHSVGIHKYYYESGSLSEIHDSYVDGKLTGSLTTYYDYGVLGLGVRKEYLRIKSVIPYIDGKKHGKEWRYYYSGKEKILVTYKDGKRNGVSAEFEDGYGEQIKWKQYLKDDKVEPVCFYSSQGLNYTSRKLNYINHSMFNDEEKILEHSLYMTQEECDRLGKKYAENNIIAYCSIAQGDNARYSGSAKKKSTAKSGIIEHCNKKDYNCHLLKTFSFHIIKDPKACIRKMRSYRR